jgi:ABC-type multidrug transport system ATPase subunit
MPSPAFHLSSALTFLLVLSSGKLTLARQAGNQTEASGLYWSGLSVQTPDGTCLVHNFNGYIANGHVCGILGPSGAGKSTTLSALGGTIAPTSGLEVNGEVTYYDSEKNTKENLQVQGGKVAWLKQRDAFFSMLTVEETLELAAFLELPKFNERQRLRRVKATMDSLGLSKLKDRRIGDSSAHKGLSGGEQRRLSLALELLASPKLFIGDEPTSGLVS